jgi:hypothetical protein
VDSLRIAGLAVLVVLLTVLKYTLRAKANRAGRRLQLPWYVALPSLLVVAGLLAYLRFAR